MRKRIWAAALAVIMLTTGCTNRMESSSEKDPVSSAAERSSSVSEGPSESRSPSSEEEPVNAAAGGSEKNFGTFSLELPEGWVVKSNVIYADDSESARIIAEVVSVDPIPDTESPFLVYDQTYSDALTVSECRFGDHPAKRYHLQKEVSEGGLTGYQNSIVYCIEAGSDMIVITFYPMRGVGISGQREEFEKILESIQV